MKAPQVAIFVVLGLALAISVVTDLRTRKIKNVVTFPTMALCLALRLAMGGVGSWDGPGLLSGIIGLLVGGGFFLVFAAMGGMGAGDVKLVAAVGAAVGCPTILACLVFIGVAGGLQAVVQLIWDGALFSTLGGMGESALEKLKVKEGDGTPKLKKKIPYGVAIAVGTVWGVWWVMSQAAVVAAESSM